MLLEILTLDGHRYWLNPAHVIGVAQSAKAPGGSYTIIVASQSATGALQLQTDTPLRESFLEALDRAIEQRPA